MIWAETSWLLFDKTYNLLPHARDNSEVGGFGEVTEFDFQFDLQTFMEVSLDLIEEAGCLDPTEFGDLSTAVVDYLAAQEKLIVYERSPDDGFKLQAANGLSTWYPPSWNKYDTRDENSLVFGSLMFYPDLEIGLDWVTDSNWVTYLFEYFDRAYAYLNGTEGDDPPKKGVNRDL